MLAQFKQYLANLGVTPEEDSGQQLAFIYNDIYYIFVYDSADPYYFRLLLPNILKIEDHHSEYMLLVNEANQYFKLAKAYVNPEGMVWATVEQYAYSQQSISTLFTRSINILKYVIEYFHSSNIKSTNE